MDDKCQIYDTNINILSESLSCPRTWCIIPLRPGMYVGTLNVNDNSDNDEIILSVGVKLLQILIVYRQTGHGYNGAVSRV